MSVMIVFYQDKKQIMLLMLIIAAPSNIYRIRFRPLYVTTINSLICVITNLYYFTIYRI